MILIVILPIVLCLVYCVVALWYIELHHKRSVNEARCRHQRRMKPSDSFICLKRELKKMLFEVWAIHDKFDGLIAVHMALLILATATLAVVLFYVPFVIALWIGMIIFNAYTWAKAFFVFWAKGRVSEYEERWNDVEYTLNPWSRYDLFDTDDLEELEYMND